MPRIPVPSPRVVGAAIVVAVVGALALMVWLIVTVVQMSHDLDRAATRAERNEAVAVENREVAAALAAQVRRLGGRPVVAPSAVPGPQGVQGIQGIPGPVGPAGRAPTLAEVIAALAEYCDDDACRGPAGEDGRDGARGPRGFPGDDGATGAQGDPGESVTGPPGPQGPPGPRGETGQTGARGEPGPTCPDGYTPQERTLRTDEQPQGETVIVCVRE